MSLEERTLVLRNIDGDNLSVDLLTELFSNFGPVLKIVLRRDFAFIEYAVKDAVAYAYAMADGISLYGRRMWIKPKLESDPFYQKYRNMLCRFNDRVHNDSKFVDSFIDEDNIEKRNVLLKQLNKSRSKLNSVRNRLRSFQKHCDSINMEFNPILRMNLYDSESNSNQRYDRRQSDYHDDNRYRNHRQSYHNGNRDLPHQANFGYGRNSYPSDNRNQSHQWNHHPPSPPFIDDRNFSHGPSYSNDFERQNYHDYPNHHGGPSQYNNRYHPYR